MTSRVEDFDFGDVVSVPFPFTDQMSHKRRPALVLSTKLFNDEHKHLVLAMITSAKNSAWPSDIAIRDAESTGLLSASIIRFKIFTLDERLIIKTLGKISKSDITAVKKRVSQIFS